MSTDRTHVCVYFDEGDLELVCFCGSRAIEEDGVLVALEDAEVTVAVLRTDLPADRRELAVPA